MNAHLTAELLALEPTPPDEVRPRRATPFEHVSISIVRPPGCNTWRASVVVHLEEGPPLTLNASAGTAREAWDEVLQFAERNIGGGAP